MHDIEQLTTVASEFEKAYEQKNCDSIERLVKLCLRVETTKDSIIKSPLNKTLFKIEKAWRDSKVKQQHSCSREMRRLIAAWKEKYFRKEKEETAQKAISKKLPKLPKTGVPARDNIREKFHEILVGAGAIKADQVDERPANKNGVGE